MLVVPFGTGTIPKRHVGSSRQVAVEHGEYFFPPCLPSPKSCLHKLRSLITHKIKDDYPETIHIISLLPVYFCSLSIYVKEIAKTSNFADTGTASTPRKTVFTGERESEYRKTHMQSI